LTILLFSVCGGAMAAGALDDPPDGGKQRSEAGDRIALDIRYGIIDRNTLQGPARFARHRHPAIYPRLAPRPILVSDQRDGRNPASPKAMKDPFSQLCCFKP
jgi:hypothetical protein